MYVRSNTDTSLFTDWRQAMPDKNTLFRAYHCSMYDCAVLWMVRDSLCEFEYHNANTNVLATLAYEVIKLARKGGNRNRLS